MKIEKNAWLLMFSDFIYSLTGIFVNTFLVAYLLKVTNENITTIATYYITLYIIKTIGCFFVEKLIKKIPSKTKSIMALGIILRALFILLIVILSNKIVNNYIWVAIMYSLSEVFYWCSHELIYIDVTTNNNRKNYMTVKQILSQVINIISPIILGASIELYSFSKIAIYVFGLSVIQIFLILFVKYNGNKQNNSIKYNYQEFLKYIKKHNLTKIKNYDISSIAYGIIESSISTLIVIITIMTFKTSLKLGMLTTIFAFFSMLSLLIYNRVYNKKYSKPILFIYSGIVIMGVFGLLINISKLSLIIYNFCYAITFCVFYVVYNTHKGDLVKECKIEKYKEEYISHTTLSIGIGRIIGYLLMLLASFTKDILYFKILLLIVTLFAPIYCYYMVKSINE